MPRTGMTNERLVELVLGARDRVAAGWSRGALARKPPDPDAAGETAKKRGPSTNPTSDEAVAWCMTGAIRAEAPHGWRNHGIRRVVQRAFDESELLNGQRIESWNDAHTQDHAVGAFDELAKWMKDTGWEPEQPHV